MNKNLKNVEVLFIAGFGPITRGLKKRARSCMPMRSEYRLREMDNGYLHTGDVEGAKHFALWPLSQAAGIMFRLF